MSSIHLCHDTVLQPCYEPPKGETQDGEEEGDRCVGTRRASGMLTWWCCDCSGQGSRGSDFSWARCLFQDVNHCCVPCRNCCQSEEILQFSELLHVKFFWGFVLVFFTGSWNGTQFCKRSWFLFLPLWQLYSLRSWSHQIIQAKQYMSWSVLGWVASS